MFNMKSTKHNTIIFKYDYTHKINHLHNGDLTSLNNVILHNIQNKPNTNGTISLDAWKSIRLPIFSKSPYPY